MGRAQYAALHRKYGIEPPRPKRRYAEAPQAILNLIALRRVKSKLFLYPRVRKYSRPQTLLDMLIDSPEVYQKSEYKHANLPQTFWQRVQYFFARLWRKK